MRKGAKIGLGITILFVSVIVGIASIPDEVLNETTTAIDNEAKIFSAPEKPESTAPKLAEPSEPVASVEPEPAAQAIPEPTEPEPSKTETHEPSIPEPTEPEPSEPETQSDEPEGNVIRVQIRDGVGFGDK